MQTPLSRVHPSSSKTLEPICQVIFRHHTRRNAKPSSYHITVARESRQKPTSHIGNERKTKRLDKKFGQALDRYKNIDWHPLMLHHIQVQVLQKDLIVVPIIS